MGGALLVLLQAICAIPVVVGCVYAVLRVGAAMAFRMRRLSSPDTVEWPGVSILKPVCGLEKDLEANLRSTCTQDYPDYQVVLSVQREDDPALPMLRRLQTEFGRERVSVAIARDEPRANGKIHNLVNALGAARHEIVVVSDSDIRLRPDFLRAIVPPLRDPKVGYSCTLYTGVRAERWYEKLEQLSLHDFIAEIVFADTTGASDFCMGSSLALRRSTLDAIGGLEALEDYLVEDFELGRRIQSLGLDLALVPYFVDAVVDLPNAGSWWRHQLYWDKNTRIARPIGFFCTVLIRPVPFALLLAALRAFDPIGLGVLGAALAVRLASLASTAALFGDRECLRNLGWVPLRDLGGLGIWLLALRDGTVTWRGAVFALTGDGRMVPLETPRTGRRLRAVPPPADRVRKASGRR